MSVADLIPRRGRPAAPLILEVVRELEPHELARLAEAPKVTVPVLKRIRYIHQRYAYLLAQGHTSVEVAQMCGCTPQRIHQLLLDPAFNDLLAQYQDSAMTVLADEAEAFKADLLDASKMALGEITDRLETEEKRKAIPIQELRKIVELGADRTVAPPKVAAPPQPPPGNITLNFGTQLKEPKIIEGESHQLPDDTSKT